ncbi:hypothetical protein [Maribacter sp. 2304DJ31-5]|uniref:hypothetical protein n=1 Tax=Maribacter sp. 2304DJ31-5 TaxID=3386273 RepID=UPI0039BC576D
MMLLYIGSPTNPNGDGNNKDGALKIWIDGDVVLDKVNTTTIYRRTKGNNIVYNKYTPKIGPYVGIKEKVGEIH